MPLCSYLGKPLGGHNFTFTGHLNIKAACIKLSLKSDTNCKKKSKDFTPEYILKHIFPTVYSYTVSKHDFKTPTSFTLNAECHNATVSAQRNATQRNTTRRNKLLGEGVVCVSYNHHLYSYRLCISECFKWVVSSIKSLARCHISEVRNENGLEIWQK